MNVVLSTGEALRFPIVTRDVTQFIVAYPVRAADVNRLLPEDLRAFDFGYGLTHMAIYWLRSGDSDFGPFCEMSVNFTVSEPYFQTQAFHYHANPVSTARACLVGYELWGNPTSLAEVAVTCDGETVGATMSQDGQFVMSLSATPASGPARTEQGTLSAAADFSSQGRSNAYRFIQTGRNCAREDRPTRVRLELGEHALSRQLRALLLDDQPLYSTYITGSTILSGPRFSELFKLLH